MRIAGLFVAIFALIAPLAWADQGNTCLFADGSSASLRKVSAHHYELAIMRNNGVTDLATINDATHEIEVNGGAATIVATEALFEEMRARGWMPERGRRPVNCARRTFADYYPW